MASPRITIGISTRIAMGYVFRGFSTSPAAPSPKLLRTIHCAFLAGSVCRGVQTADTHLLAIQARRNRHRATTPRQSCVTSHKAPPSTLRPRSPLSTPPDASYMATNRRLTNGTCQAKLFAASG
eukprot:scaffold2452_cov303-Prasinococcus_capsulatus_cf.AAC.5